MRDLTDADWKRIDEHLEELGKEWKAEARRKAEQNALERNFGKDGKQEARVYDKFFLHDTYITKEEYLKNKDNYILY